MSQPSQQSTQATLEDRLRSRAVPVSISGVEQSDSIFTEAADEIERLRKVVHRAHRAQGMGPCICADCEGRGYDD